MNLRFDLEKLFLQKNYPLILNVSIASILFVLYKIGVSEDKLIPFLVAWLLFYLITSITENKLKYDSIQRLLQVVSTQSTQISSLGSMQEAYDYLSSRLKTAYRFKNTIFNVNPASVKEMRREFVSTVLKRLKDPSFEMYELISKNDSNIEEAKEKVAVSSYKYFYSVITHPSIYLIPFSIIYEPQSTELVVGWYGVIHKPHHKDVYLVIKDERIVQLFEDYFDEAFDSGTTELDS